MTAAPDVPWAIELSGFVKCYAGNRVAGPGRAACDLSLRLAPGQVLGIFGPNGSGKSTMLKALAGLITPSRGECRVFGHQAGSNEARALVGYLPDSPLFPGYLTGREFLHYCAGLSSLSPKLAAPRIGAVLDWAALGLAADQRVDAYSKGMRQRLGLAQAVLHEPPLVLLDEPAGGLDPVGRQALNGLIRSLAQRGTTVVFSSHLLGQAESLCDRITLIGQGRILAEGTPRELFGADDPTAAQPSRLEQLYLERISVDA